MAEMKYHVVRLPQQEHDDIDFQIYWGTQPPHQPKDESESKQKAFEERWVQSNWEIIASYDNEDEAEKRADEERHKAKKLDEDEAGKKENEERHKAKAR